jgi:DNA-binding NarL/FixJ family response regulator
MVIPGKQIGKTRVLLLEEQPLLRYGVSTYLNLQPDMIVCGETDNISDTRSKIAECKPHLLLTALRLGNGDSLELIKAIKTQHPGLLILVYSAFEETIFAERALRAGANGYLMKKAPRDEILTAIRDILRGQIYVSRDLALHAFQRSLETPSRTRASGTLPAVDDLSDREMHVFQLIGSGLGTKKIAHSLNLSVKTIETHRENIKRKLGLNSSRQVVEHATKWVEETFLPSSKGEAPGARKKKVVPFRAA